MARKASKISIVTIAKELGISPSTISRVLNNRTGVGEETRRAVLEIARKYDFKLNYPQQHQPLIATVLSSKGGISNYTSKVLTGVYEYFATHNFRVNTIVLNPEIDTSVLQAMREQQCAGGILIQPMYFKEQLPELAASGLPIMEIDSSSGIPEIGFIDNDAYSGAVELTKHLLSLGHKKIGFLLCWPDSFNHIQRLKGYTDTLTSAGIYNINNLVISNGDSSVGIGECAGIMLSELLKKEPNVTAVIGVNDDLALGAMHWAIRSGIKIPDDLSIAGFDDNDFCRFVIPEMTSVSHPCREAGFRAAAAVATHIESNGKIPLPKEVLSTKLIPRYSTGQAKKNF
jgi:DNA-binding LacI/PurR family transcriptional regulator